MLRLNLMIALGMLVPFFGTLLGAACVFLMRRELRTSVQRILAGFSAGVMLAASFWSLLLPSIERSNHLGAMAFFPAAVGLWIGMTAMLVMEKVLPCLMKRDREDCSGSPDLLLLAVTLHNIPEGMAVGAAIAGCLAESGENALTGALILAVGIAVQNIPEGAVVSMPAYAKGSGRGKACFLGVMSGAVEPAAALLTLLASRWIVPVLPYLLSFAAGAMIYVVEKELIPEMETDQGGLAGSVFLAIGFTFMMALDVALG